MTLIRKLSKPLKLALFLTCVASAAGLASQFDADPIRSTQSNAVAVTEENIKDEGRPAAPAPSFHIIGNMDKFLVKMPVERVREEKEKKFHWWFLEDQAEPESTEKSESYEMTEVIENK